MRKAKLLTNQDVELELWESLKFLEATFERLREEQMWVKVRTLLLEFVLVCCWSSMCMLSSSRASICT